MTPNLFAIGDLHGRYDLFKKAVAKIEKLADGGKIVFLGDYVDRGPQSYEILKALRKGPPSGWEWIILKGNHEVMMHDDDPYFSRVWEQKEGIETIKSFLGTNKLSKYRAWVGTFLDYHIDGRYIFVHANWNEQLLPENQTESDMQWTRRPKGTAFFSKNGEILVHGHTPYEDGPELSPNRINLDVRAWVSGRIVVAQLFEDRQEFYNIKA